MMAVYIAAFVFGVVAGLRTFIAPAALYLARGGIAGYVLALFALGELFGDLQPNVPPRTFPPALIARIASGAFVGWMLCVFRGASPGAGAAAGAVGAVIGTYGGKTVRLGLIERFGAVPAALIEDAIAIVLAAVCVIAVSPR
ncbi:MAG: hypothetical protein JWM87_4796 [Candidatus Eremiobacteraeota bacterium]|nr:hypothetical protein [Candidatus Eremiobacteraeota bacterium]